MRFVLLAAGKGSRIYSKIKKPKCLLEINNISLIEHIINNISNFGNPKIDIVVGFESNKIIHKLKKNKRINYIYNDFYNTRDMLYSFILALKKIDDDILFSYTDIFYDKLFLKKICNIKSNKILLPITCNWRKIWSIRKKNFLLDGEDLKIDKNNFLLGIGGKIDKKKITKYQYAGILFVPRNLKKKIISLYETFSDKKMHITKFLDILVKKNFKIRCLKLKSPWYEFDDWEDYKNFKKS